MRALGTVIVVGHGLVGRHVLESFEGAGWATRYVSRSTASAGLSPVDLGSSNARSRLASELLRSGADHVVLAHGPTRIESCEEDPALAADAHRGGAEAAMTTGLPVTLVSSDAVFKGCRRHRPSDALRPANAYGHAKLQAEEALRPYPQARIVRLSMLYGAADPAVGSDFVSTSLRLLCAGSLVEAPFDQYNTPLHVADAADAIRLLATSANPSASVCHAAGSELLSRFAIAREVATAGGFDPPLVVPVARLASRWRTRPPYACLESTVQEVVPELSAWSPRSVHVGLRQLISATMGAR